MGNKTGGDKWNLDKEDLEKEFPSLVKYVPDPETFEILKESIHKLIEETSGNGYTNQYNIKNT